MFVILIFVESLLPHFPWVVCQLFQITWPPAGVFSKAECQRNKEQEVSRPAKLYEILSREIPFLDHFSLSDTRCLFLYLDLHKYSHSELFVQFDKLNKTFT